MKRRKLRKNRIIVCCLILCAVITFLFRGCFKGIAPLEEKKDTVPPMHLNDTLSNSMSEGGAYHEMDSLVERYLKRWEINGAQLVITRNDSLLYARGFGYADKEKGIKMEPNMVMRFASVSKLITAVGIMKLQEMKKLRLSDKVFGPKGILTDTTYSNSIKDPRYYDITVEQLLRHNAGFTNGAGDPMFSTRYIIMQNHLTTPPDHKTLLRILLKRKLGYTPGQGRCYSNLGYMILSEIITKKSGMKYADFMQKYVLNPAACFDMHIAGTYYKDKRPNEVKYYMHQGSVNVLEYNNSGRMVPRCYGENDVPRLEGAGAWCGSAAELSRLIASIDGLPHVKDIISAKSVAMMTQEQPDHNFSLGWNFTAKGKPWIRTGSLSGTSALVLKYPDNQCWILITNTSTWKGHGFSNDTMAFFEKLRQKYMANMPKKDLFEAHKDKKNSKK